MITLANLERHHHSSALELWNSSVEYDQVSSGVFMENVFDDPSAPVTLRHAAFADGDLVGFAISTTHSPREGFGCLKMFAVSSQWQRNKIGSSLIKRVETELREQGCVGIRIAECPPNYLQAGLDARSTSVLTFLAAQGFSAFSEAVNMTVDLRTADLDTTRSEAALVQKGLAIRRARADDRQAIMSFLATEFPAWTDEVAVTFVNKPISLHIAERTEQSPPKSKIIAFSAYDANNLGSGWFGPMGTEVAARGLGIGEVLLKRCLADLLQQKHTEAVIPWVGPIAFYSKTVGATLSRTFVRLEKALVP